MKTIEVSEQWLEELKYKYELLCRKNNELQKKYDELRSVNESNEFKLKTELEPRIKAEQRAYDRYVSTDTGAEQCECFEYYLEEMIDLVKDNETNFDWDRVDGDLAEKILYLIKQEI